MPAGLPVSAEHAAYVFWGECCGSVVVRFNSQVKSPTAAMLFAGCLTDFPLAGLLSSPGSLVFLSLVKPRTALDICKFLANQMPALIGQTGYGHVGMSNAPGIVVSL